MDDSFTLSLHTDEAGCGSPFGLSTWMEKKKNTKQITKLKNAVTDKLGWKLAVLVRASFLIHEAHRGYRAGGVPLSQPGGD